MYIRRVAVSAAFAVGLAALPLAVAHAQYYPPQYYYPPCSPFPLFWPFCLAGAIVGTAATIVTAPFVALTGPPYLLRLLRATLLSAAALSCGGILRVAV